MKIVALMRAADDAAATASRLAARGYATALAPAIEFSPRATAAPSGRFDGVIVTSARALAFAPFEAFGLDDPPFYVVGARVAAAAAGRRIVAVAEDAAALARLIVAEARENARLVYLAGVDRKPELEGALGAAGFELVVAEVYEARARAAWSEAEADGVARAAAALHYSRRSAELACRLADRAGLAASWRELVHVAISEDAAAPLTRFGATAVAAAETPDEAAMLAALERALPA